MINYLKENRNEFEVNCTRYFFYIRTKKGPFEIHKIKITVVK
ncbi:hypothetical protein CLV48_104207 [Cecembia rubra]|uniref:Uncharacterized protein n=1 Tax=Cecembia rubra TaxID=1485585 RepID=A0A2P8E6D5_9BACT|nr:hypothetical protein CLV48_104207 [Cecembia rubra]